MTAFGGLAQALCQGQSKAETTPKAAATEALPAA
eukprot:CAMPEP_0180695826 /NCGR_PEP_ID=MMETSP1038_2-20121128/2655_1 /TAXON_ID=632150 /ORGANISM="Azadinium spinosum, Strain 3D9" /LENGTH=33 /DNA_ID= /DNA_START= /DNA_END= /DNA_ORIENTATION=